MIRDLTIVIPAYNEAHRIGATLERLSSRLPALLGTFEVVVVDDGSTDGTRETVEARAAEGLRLISHAQRRGKGAAVRTGIAAATKPWVLFTDADLPVSLDQLEGFFRAAAETPVVIASKRLRESSVDQPLQRRLAGRLGSWIVSLLAVPGFRDTQCGFKLFRSDVARALFAHQRIDGFGFDFEVLFLARRFGIGVTELPADVTDAGGSSVSSLSYAKVLCEIAALLRNRLLGRYPAGPTEPIT